MFKQARQVFDRAGARGPRRPDGAAQDQRPARARGAGQPLTDASRPDPRRRTAAVRPQPRFVLRPAEPRRTLLDEGGEALGVIGGRSGLALDLGLVLELLVERRGPAPSRAPSSARSPVARRRRGAGRAPSPRQTRSDGTTRATRPIRSASAARSGSPGRASSAASAPPISRGRSHVAPESGTSPTRPNASRKLASSAAMRTSQANASDAPAPAAIPLTAPTIGFGSDRIARISGLYRRRISSARGAASGSSRSRRSWPALKARPAPVRTTARTAGRPPSAATARRGAPP